MYSFFFLMLKEVPPVEKSKMLTRGKFGSSDKELGSHHSVLTANKKLNRMKNQKLCCEIHFHVLNQLPTVNIQEKSLPASGRGEKKELFWNKTEHSVFLNKACPQAKLVNQSLTCLDTKFSSVAQSCPTLCDPMDHSMPGFPVHRQLPELTQTHVYGVGDAI